jgi:hypothetical protein
MRKQSRGSGVHLSQIQTSQHPISISQLHWRISGGWTKRAPPLGLGSPSLHISRSQVILAANKFSDNPAHLEWRERHADGLRKAGLPEE